MLIQAAVGQFRSADGLALLGGRLFVATDGEPP
jgi:hypothetical protein